MDNCTAKKKRGRKHLDAIDVDIKTSRKRLLRGIPFFMAENANSLNIQPIDELVWVALQREKEIVKTREIVEIREIPIEEDNISLGGSPVATRMAIPTMSVAKCLNNSFAQLVYSDRIEGNGNCTPAFFTPEAHILTSKACELFIHELAVRSYMNAVSAGSPHMLSAADLVAAIRSAWRSSDSYSSNGSMDFLIDVVDRATDNPRDGLDLIANLHRTA